MLARLVTMLTCIALCLPVVPATAQTPGATPASADTRRIRAVIIGVAGYTQEGIAPLIGAYNDASLVADTLIRNGASRDDITLLVDRPPAELLQSKGNPTLRDAPMQADGIGTRANILGALKRLVEVSRPGDEIVISFSGHGFQQEDDEPGEEPDGLDEIFLPFDIEPSVDGKVLRNAIVDDEIGAVIDAIRAKGANVLYIGDFCHSGDSNRDAGSDPGVTPDKQALNLKAQAKFSSVSGGNFVRDLAVETRATGAGMGAYVGMLAAPADTQAKQYMAPNFASRESQAPHGILTVYTMLNLANGRVHTYRDLAARVNSNIDGHRKAPRPLFDGDLDRPVLGGLIAPGKGGGQSWTVEKPLTTVGRDEPVKLDSLEMAAGELQGVTRDSIIGLSLVGDGGEKTILYGKVEDVDAYRAVLKPVSYGEVTAEAWQDVRDLEGRPFIRAAKLIATIAEQPVSLDYRIALPERPAAPSPAQASVLKAFDGIRPEDVGASFVKAGQDADLVLRFDGDRLAIDEPVEAPESDFGSMDIGATYSAAAASDPDRAVRFELGQALVRAAKFHRLRRVLAGVSLSPEEDSDPAANLQVRFYAERPKQSVGDGESCPDTSADFYALGPDAKPLEEFGQRDAETFALQRCDWLFVEVKNTGDEELYVNPLIFSPDGSIYLMQAKAANPTRFAPNERGVLQYQLTDARVGSDLRDDLVILVSEASDGTAVSFAKLEQCPVAPGPEDIADCQSPASLSGTQMRSGASGSGSAIEQLIDSALQGSTMRGGTASRPSRTSARRFSWTTRGN